MKYSVADAILEAMWQDYVISICIAVFIIALIPSIRGTNKPELSSCLTTAAVQLVLTATYVTLDLWYSVATGILLLACWTTLGIQQFRIRRRRKNFFITGYTDLAGNYYDLRD